MALLRDNMIFIDQEIELKLTIARLRIEVANLKNENEQIKNSPFLKRLKYLPQRFMIRFALLVWLAFHLTTD